MTKTAQKHNEIYYFLGNITSHILHALPLYKQLGGTFIVLSERAKKELDSYDVPVVVIDDRPHKWIRFGIKVKPVNHYQKIGNDLKKTVDYLNKHAQVVIFYELFDFYQATKLTRPKTIFLTHGNMLKSYMQNGNRLEIIKQYDYMAALGPFLKKEFIEQDGIDPEKLVDIGIARTDEIVANKGKVILPKHIIDELKLDPKKPIFSYIPTFWGPSSVYDTGLEIVRNFPDKYTLIFRPHPQTPSKIITRYLNIIKTKPNVIYAPEGRFKNFGLVELFNASSAIIGDVSSVTLEAILTEKPLVFAYGADEHSHGANEYRAIQEIVSMSQIINPENARSITKILDTSLKNKINVKVWSTVIKRTFYHSNGTSVASIASFIKSLMS